MLRQNGAAPDTAATVCGGRRIVGVGERDRRSSKPSPNYPQAKAIRAELRGSDTCTALGMTARSSSPVLALCRDLIDAGHNPGEPLEAWRGGTLCLRIRAIGVAAGLKINARGTGFVPCAVRAGSPTRRPGKADSGGAP